MKAGFLRRHLNELRKRRYYTKSDWAKFKEPLQLKDSVSIPTKIGVHIQLGPRDLAMVNEMQNLAKRRISDESKNPTNSEKVNGFYKLRL